MEASFAISMHSRWSQGEGRTNDSRQLAGQPPWAEGQLLSQGLASLVWPQLSQLWALPMTPTVKPGTVWPPAGSHSPCGLMSDTDTEQATRSCPAGK